MKCPTCGLIGKILETRTNDDESKRRRYECKGGHRYSTREIISKDELHSQQILIKSSGGDVLSTVWSPRISGRAF